MRICLVAHGFPPVERTGVENYTLGLARALARAGQRVEVFVPRRDPVLAELSLRREERDGFAVNWITQNRPVMNPREALLGPELAAAFGAFLERERPEVVHFQHFVKLGVDLVDAARERGIPTLYTAHDYYAICHRYTLLRPDLVRCDARGDSLACARCDLALGHLNALSGLGDYQMGALPEQLAPGDRARLSELLADSAPAGAPERAALAAAHELRSELDRRRAEAYRGVDLLLSPSRFLIEELSRAGIERERLELQPFGFDNADLEGLAPVRRDPARPVRFAFLGGLSKHKGVHVLLDAFAELRSGAELAIWGDSSDRPYVELLRRRTGEVGALWRGAYERAELPGILAEVDALVLPSIWVENYPLVIREGFSARRPVLASRVGALPESVRDGVDGLLFEPGDAADLARTMRRCVEEPGLLPALSRGIAPVKGIDAHATELLACYARLCAKARAGAPAAAPLASLRAPLARFEELSGLPTRELFTRALAGLDELRLAWAPEVAAGGTAELLSTGLGEGSHVQDALREARSEIAWLRAQSGHSEAEITWLRSQKVQSEAEIAWLREKRQELEQGRDELLDLWNNLDKLLDDVDASQKQRALIESAGAYVRTKEAEVLAAQEQLRGLEATLAQKDGHLHEVEGQLLEAGRYIRGKDQEYTEVERELRATAQRVEARESELRTAQASLGSLERGTRSVAELGLTAIEIQERMLRRLLLPILERLHRIQLAEGVPETPAEGAHFGELVGALRQVLDGLGAIEVELAWRRERMERLLQQARGTFSRLSLALTPVGRELRDWRAAPRPELSEPTRGESR